MKNDIWPSLKKAIGEAKKFIYMEDQYLWSVDAATELNKALKNGLKSVTLLTTSDDSLQGLGRPLRRLAFNALIDGLTPYQLEHNVGVCKPASTKS
jgi:hypothetical protein